MTDRVHMAPSILSVDFAQLGPAVQNIAAGGADFIHVDVMDGHFVPNLTIGPPVIDALKQITDVPLDVHLMIDNADQTFEWYLDAGADWLTVHVEACDHPHRVMQAIRDRGAHPGIALNPGTPASAIADLLEIADLVLVMSVNPGFGGQSFIESTIPKIERIAQMCDTLGACPLIQVDGGINSETAPRVTAVGARCLVAGSAVFCQDDPVTAMEQIRAAGQASIG